jgi:hypothetical protein
MTDKILEVIAKKPVFPYLTEPRRRKGVALLKLVKNMVDRRQTEYWDEISLEIETAIKQHD